MAQTSLKNQPWKCGQATIIGLPPKAEVGRPLTVELRTPDVPLDHARIVWEAADQEPVFGKNFEFIPASSGPKWIEAEAQLPDGRRVFAVTNLVVRRW